MYRGKFILEDLCTKKNVLDDCSRSLAENENNQLKASTLVSCIIHYLEENCVTDSKTPVVIYYDGYGYQNRNNILANALLNFAIKHNVLVFEKYLEPGHSQMECDSVHSMIDRRLENKEIHLPSDYASITDQAMKGTKPYRVKILDHTFFKDHSSSNHMRYSSIRPGRKAYDPTITDIRYIKYDPVGTIEI
ncbi:unnamed protein product [Diabrotica balteata]|uniref:Uncharacterized protein n=1 Tax=Diabrotica balteata TaxID=107213 RepID=A0A9N9XG77_DIABA|nr:unnamed protein product [Diabrotica balteata]